jgi:hypothetical protein
VANRTENRHALLARVRVAALGGALWGVGYVVHQVADRSSAVISYWVPYCYGNVVVCAGFAVRRLRAAAAAAAAIILQPLLKPFKNQADCR